MKEQRSLRKKQWLVQHESDSIEALQAAILEASSTDQPQKVWLSPTWDDLADPKKMKGLGAAADRIKTAIKNDERIMVYGDFDADGITATVSLVHGLKRLGAQVSYRIPHRINDSHGLKKDLIDEIVQANAKLLITVDCGMNDRAEVDYAKAAGLEVIITDHHQVDRTRMASNALTLCNPRQPDCRYPHKNLAGVGVVFKLLQLLAPNVDWLKPYLALTALGTVADCINLHAEARTMVQLGLKELNQNHWPVVRTLLGHQDVITEETIGYGIAPMLNAASRLGQVQHAVQLFLAEDNRAWHRVEYLTQLNEERRLLTKEQTAVAESLVQPESSAQVLFLEDCPIGILGLVASRLVETLHQPILCLTVHPHGGLHGSARAPQGASLTNMLEAGHKYLTNFGGHDGAAGFRLQEAHLADFMQHVQAWYASHPPTEPMLDITAQVEPEWLTQDWYDWQQSLSPFGMGNPQPVWQLPALRLEEVKPMGREGVHARLQFARGIEVVAFFVSDILDLLKVGQSYELAVSLHQNTWNGESRLQWQLVDVRN